MCVALDLKVTDGACHSFRGHKPVYPGGIAHTVCFDEQKHQKGVTLPLTHRPHVAQPNLPRSSAVFFHPHFPIHTSNPTNTSSALCTSALLRTQTGNFYCFLMLWHIFGRTSRLCACFRSAERLLTDVEWRAALARVDSGGGGTSAADGWENPRSQQESESADDIYKKKMLFKRLGSAFTHMHATLSNRSKEQSRGSSGYFKSMSDNVRL